LQTFAVGVDEWSAFQILGLAFSILLNVLIMVVAVLVDLLDLLNDFLHRLHAIHCNHFFQ